MNKRAKFSLAILALGLLLEFSPARSQAPRPTDPLTRPRTVTLGAGQQDPSRTPAAPITPAATASAALQQAGGGARALPVSKIRARIDEAKRLLKSRPTLTAMTGHEPS